MHTFFAENWVPVVLLTAFFLLYFCSFLSYYHDVKDGPEFFLFLYAKKKIIIIGRGDCRVVLFFLKSVCVFVHARSQMWVKSCLLKLTLCVFVMSAGEKEGMDAQRRVCIKKHLPRLLGAILHGSHPCPSPGGHSAFIECMSLTLFLSILLKKHSRCS